MTDFKFYKFIENFRLSGTLARECNYLGEVYDPESTARRINSGFDRPIGAPAGYFGLCYRGTFYWGPCPDLSCDEADSAINVGSGMTGTVNEAYEYEMTVVDLLNPPTITGLPDGLTATVEQTLDEFDDPIPDAWTVTITGTPVEAGESTVIVSGKSKVNECPMAAGFNLTVEPCDLDGSFITIGEWPAAEQFEAWEAEIDFVDVMDIEVLGLPDEVTATIGAGTITLESEELPATASYNIMVRGTTTTNGCPIQREFLLHILPCESDEASILVVATNLLFLPQIIVEGNGLSDLVCETTLPGWLEFYTETGPDGVILGGLTWGATADCESGTMDLKIIGTTALNECTIRKAVTVQLSCDCPSPTDYSALGANIAKIHSGQFKKSGSLGNIARFMCTNCDFAGASASSNLPAGLELISGTSTWIDSNLWIVGTPAASVANGTYIIRITTTVNSGTHAGCQIIRDYSIVVVD
jgi:hypothetical protein